MKRALIAGVALLALGGQSHAAFPWYHNGSTLSLVADGNSREFHYEQPSPGMWDAGAEPGSLLFQGIADNGYYFGTAYLFRGYCGQFAYQVSGPILNNYRKVVLHGRAPRVDSNCQIQGYIENTLEFTYLAGRTVPKWEARNEIWLD